MMLLNIKESFNRRLITPWEISSRTYYLLFFKNHVKGPFYVEDSPFSLNGLITIGDIRQQETKKIAGNIFYTSANAQCTGSSLLAYSGVFKHSVQRQVPKNFNMDLVVKTPFMQVFNRKNSATLVISPFLKSNIKQNLEI